MKALRYIALLTTSLLLGPCALAQSDATQPTNPSVAAARCQYAQADDACRTVAQAPQHPPRPPRHPAGPPTAQVIVYTPPRPVPSASHAIIGAVIGFTIGAVAPANATARTRFSVGLVTGLFGGLIGATIPSSPSYHHRHRWPDEDDEDAEMRSRFREGSGARATSAASASPTTPNLAKSAPPIEPQPPLPASDK